MNDDSSRPALTGRLHSAFLSLLLLLLLSQYHLSGKPLPFRCQCAEVDAAGAGAAGRADLEGLLTGARQFVAKAEELVRAAD